MIDRLDMFVALARERHFGRAAAACGVTQPTLSAGLRALEDQLGVQLVFRGSRFQGLTPEGARVLDWALRITADARAMREEMRAARHGLSGRLTIGVIPTALPRIARLTAPFAARHPGVSLRILSATSAEILSGLDDHRMDAGLTYLDNEPLGRVTTLPLYDEGYVLLTAAAGPLAGADRVDWAGLAGLPLCLLTSDMQNRRIVNQHLAAAGVGTEAALESNSVLALVAHVATGAWVSVLPEALAELVTAPGTLRAIPLGGAPAGHKVGLVVPARDPHTPVLEALIATARRIGTTDARREAPARHLAP
ncbi:LysR family transcriptional regulator [Gemmobacter sp.]|uniref:LysR family transcriptional regulator n=1 Tax=Gemmobacter sp. TaxID=1898957 RepID=UPI002AFE8100|nr:LysR family transcriptional regulator [Gemmobacter sp.]